MYNFTEGSICGSIPGCTPRHTAALGTTAAGARWSNPASAGIPPVDIIGTPHNTDTLALVDTLDILDNIDTLDILIILILWIF